MFTMEKTFRRNQVARLHYGGPRERVKATRTGNIVQVVVERADTMKALKRQGFALVDNAPAAAKPAKKPEVKAPPPIATPTPSVPAEPEPPAEPTPRGVELSAMAHRDRVALAKKLDIKGRSMMSKEALIEAILEVDLG